MTISDPASEPAHAGAQPAGGEAAAGAASAADPAHATAKPASESPAGPAGAAPAAPAGNETAKAEIPNFRLHGLWRDFMTGFGFFTRLPTPATDQPLAEVALVFPVIGAVIGLAATVFYMLGLWIGLSGLMSAILAVAATALLTGALHDDGLADYADMLGVRGDRMRKLAVMRNSTIGSYGTLALIFVNLMKVAALADLAVPGQVAGALIAAHALSRGVLPVIMRSYPLARSNGLAVHAGKPSSRSTLSALAVAALLAGLVGGPSVAIVATGAALVVAFLVAHVAHRQLGGYTGDVLGAAEQLIEVTVILNFVSFT